MLKLFVGFVALVPGDFLPAQEIPSGGQSLVNVADIATEADFYSGTNDGQTIASRTIVEVSGQPFTQAARIEVAAPDGDFWSSAITASSNRALANGDVVLLHVFLRAIATTDETGTVSCHVFAEGPAPEYTKSISQAISAGPEWIEYFLPFEVVGDYAAGEFGIKFGFGAGTRPQTLEIADARAIWYAKTRTIEEMPRTSFNYEGRALDADWRREAGRRIEQYRKSNYTITVVNNDGLPVPNASVRIIQRRHLFEFGTAIQAARIVDQSDADNQMYRAKLTELFNAGTLENDLKWPAWDGDWGSGFNREQALAALQWLREDAALAMRGHVLVWPSARNLPNSIVPLLPTADPSIPQRVLDHITDVVDATAAYLHDWDVLNEPYDNHDLMDLFGSDIMVDWFEHARTRHATARLFVNEYGILSGGGLNEPKQDAYANTIRLLRDSGAPIGGIGIQGHFDASPTGMSRAWSILERYAQEFPELAIRITEFDVDTDDEELQADYTRDLLTLAFSHPSVIGFQTWGFWEGAHWRERAAMYRLDWSEKPNGASFRELVHVEWKTDETRLTGPDGRVRGRGFHGDYELTVSVGGVTHAEPIAIGTEEVNHEIVIDTAVDAAPRITRQPFGQTVAPGEDVRVEVGVSGLPAPQVTWYRNGIALASVGTTLDITGASAGDEGVYHAEITNALGTTQSRQVRVGVRAVANRQEKLANISTRGSVLGGDQLLIAGFAISGEGTKEVLLRGIGPKLAEFGVPVTLADPRLRLFRSGQAGAIAENEDWEAQTGLLFEELGAFDLASDPRSAALHVVLEPGVYTLHLQGAERGPGVGLIEAYDAATNEPLDLVNISTRGQVGTGSEILIAGFVIKGEVPQHVLVRGVGPGLAGLGVDGVLADPRLTVFESLPDDTTRRIVSNDDWTLGDLPSSGAEAIRAAEALVGAFPLEDFSRDACLLLWLEPGTYSAHLAGSGESSGLALVEVYAVP